MGTVICAPMALPPTSFKGALPYRKKGPYAVKFVPVKKFPLYEETIVKIQPPGPQNIGAHTGNELVPEVN